MTELSKRTDGTRNLNPTDFTDTDLNNTALDNTTDKADKISTVGIVGLGLIGGSLGLDLRSQGYRVMGASQRASTCETAEARGVVDRASPDLASLAEADVIFLCTPLSSLESTTQRLIPYLNAETILTDVGSVKTPIVESIQVLWKNFVGGHPMAGTAESGINAAIPNLFAGNPYVLTPTPETPTRAIAVVSTIAQDLGALLYRATPEAHDRAVAWISHSPVMISASLIAACLEEPDTEVLQLAQNLASSGFRDTSRVGGGNPELGLLMAQLNRSNVLRSLHAYRQQLDHVIQHIQQENWETLELILRKTQEERPKFLREST